MNENIEVSVILPIYNAEKFLEETLNSIENQTFKNIEIICVNDGSTDSSIKIIKQFMEKDNRVKLVDKKNEGVWKARLDGIKAAKGNFIVFIDSDDTILENYIEKLYDSITKKNADISICGFKRIDAKTNKVISKEMKYANDKIIEEKNFEEIISVNTALWNKMYKTSLLKQFDDLSKPPRILEDMMFLAILYLKVCRVSFVDEYLYNYMVREGSAMNTLKNNEIEKIREPMLEVKEKYIKDKCSEKKMEILSAMAFLHFGISLMLRVSMSKNYDFNKEYKENLEFLNKNFPKWKKTKYLKLSYAIVNKGVNLKLSIVKKMYSFHLFKVFLVLYKFITEKLKIDVKW